jgi:SOS-response transcriptional repressor LexA
MLGIATSTYQNYETCRVPPAQVLVRIADVAGVDLRWLLTGEREISPKIPASHPVLQRATELIGDRPDAAEPLAAFLDILAASLKFPEKQRPRRPAGEAITTAAPQRRPETPEDARGAWIPILGRTAAGVPHFWATGADAAGITMVAELVDRHARRVGRSSTPATVSIEREAIDSAVQIITMPAPAEGEAAEFVSAPAIKARYGDAFALRVDGDSMAPEILHGDLVILSPSAPAADGRPAIVQLARQIGVTCKLYRHDGRNAHLIPVNEAFSPQAFSASEVAWALRVLARVRPRPD